MPYFSLLLNGFKYTFRKSKSIFAKMPEMSTIDRIKENAQIAKDTITLLKNELNVISNEYNNILARQLREENARLTAAVEEAKKNLIQLEIQNGVTQIAIPKQKTTVEPSNLVKETPIESRFEPPQAGAKAKKEKKVKEPKAPKETPVEAPVDIGRLDLRIARVEDVQRHPDADTLYVLKINAGEAQPRTVCSGLVKHLSLDDLKNRSVLLLCNLKPVKMRGIVSEAMVMCASSDQGVEVLTPPSEAQPGDLVHCEGYARQPDAVMNPKKKIFETVAPELHTNNNLEACYKDTPLKVPGKGTILSSSLKNVPVK